MDGFAPPQELNHSALGTKPYWDDAYELEIKNHAENPEDGGAIWFEDCGAEDKVVEELAKLRFGSRQTERRQDTNGDGDRDRPDEHEDGDGEENPFLLDHTIRILDLGTGNGHMLFALRDEGWVSQMVGVDYSPASVSLARQIQRQRLNDLEDEPDARVLPVQFELFDILSGRPGAWLGPGFDIVLDKGTFDAVSLNTEADEAGRKGFELYGKRVEGLVRPGGYLLITSCNWTEEELRKWFESEELVYHDRIKYRSFTYAGVKGQTISSVFFRRNGGDN